MAIGNGMCFRFEGGLELNDLFEERRCAFVVELAQGEAGEGLLPGSLVRMLGVAEEKPEFEWRGNALPPAELERAYDGTLEGVYPTTASCGRTDACGRTDSCGRTDACGRMWASAPTAFVDSNDGACAAGGDARVAPPKCRVRLIAAKPRVLIPVFPGTNCEYDSARAVENAGAEARVMVLNTQSAAGVKASAEAFAKELSRSQTLFLPGGFSGGDEPDGSGKFITAFLRNPAIADEIAALLEQRDGLILGVCNGFQALVKLGLVPYGRVTAPAADSPTLTFNAIGRHQSRLVRTRVASKKSPWLLKADESAVYTVPISHGEGRFLCEAEQLAALAKNGQIATQYVNMEGQPSMEIDFNPAGSLWAVEGVTSPDGRVFGKMGHSERIGANLYRNVPGVFNMKLFESAVEYFK